MSHLFRNAAILAGLAWSGIASHAGPLDAVAAAAASDQRGEMRVRQEIEAKAQSFIQRHGELYYGDECRDLTLPDGAFLPVEIDGLDAARELAVTYGRALCRDYGKNMFTGTGGAVVQFWQIQGDRPRLLLEQSVHGFTAQAPYLVTLQHGGVCPGGAGPSACRVIYRWDALGGRFETESRELLDDGWVLHDYGTLTGASACLGRERQRLCR